MKTAILGHDQKRGKYHALAKKRVVAPNGPFPAYKGGNRPKKKQDL